MGQLHSSIVILVFAVVITPLCRAEETLDTAPIISAMIELTEDADATVRYAAFDALGRRPQTDQFLELFWRGLEDDSTRIRRLCLDKIVEREGPTARVFARLISLQEKPLASLPEKPKDFTENAMAAEAQKHLIAFGATAVPYLLEALKRNEANHDAVSALGKIPLGEYQATVAVQLTALLKSESKSVRLAAVQSLQSIMIAEAKGQALAETGGIDPRLFAYYTKVLQKYDSNADGSLAKDEWNAMSKDPAAADTDQDGKITAVELAKWLGPQPK